jgi:uncharacterized protein (TIGR02246 family)
MSSTPSRDVSGASAGLAAALAAARTAFVAALNEGDASAAAVAYAEDARMLAPSADLLEGRDAIGAFWRAGLEAGIADVELDVIEVAHAEVAYELGRYALSLQPADGAAIVDRGKYLLIHARQADGSWRRAVEMFGPDAPATRPLLRDPSKGEACASD